MVIWNLVQGFIILFYALQQYKVSKHLFRDTTSEKIEEDSLWILKREYFEKPKSTITVFSMGMKGEILHIIEMELFVG